MIPLKVFSKQPGKPAEPRVIPNDLKSLQDVVDGPIEIVSLGSGILLICNGEGKLAGMDLNFVYQGEMIVGPVLFARRGRNGELISLNHSDITFIRKICEVKYGRKILPCLRKEKLFQQRV